MSSDKQWLMLMDIPTNVTEVYDNQGRLWERGKNLASPDSRKL